MAAIYTLRYAVAADAPDTAGWIVEPDAGPITEEVDAFARAAACSSVHDCEVLVLVDDIPFATYLDGERVEAGR